MVVKTYMKYLKIFERWEDDIKSSPDYQRGQIPTIFDNIKNGKLDYEVDKAIKEKDVNKHNSYLLITCIQQNRLDLIRKLFDNNCDIYSGQSRNVVSNSLKEASKLEDNTILKFILGKMLLHKIGNFTDWFLSGNTLTDIEVTKVKDAFKQFFKDSFVENSFRPQRR